MTNPKIILATKSPYRKEAFEMLGIDFVCEGSDVEEKFDGRPDDPEGLVLHLSKLKAQAIAQNHQSGIVVGFDSVGWFEGKVLEKPASKEEAFERLKRLSGKTHEFFTGIHVVNIDTGTAISDVVKTEIETRTLTDQEIEKYLNQDPKFNTYAMGYDPLGHFSSTFPIGIKGSYNNFLRGIPLEKIVEMLKRVGYEI